jgi:hypothetical protein
VRVRARARVWARHSRRQRPAQPCPARVVRPTAAARCPPPHRPTAPLPHCPHTPQPHTPQPRTHRVFAVQPQLCAQRHALGGAGAAPRHGGARGSAHPGRRVPLCAGARVVAARCCSAGVPCACAPARAAPPHSTPPHPTPPHPTPPHPAPPRPTAGREARISYLGRPQLAPLWRRQAALAHSFGFVCRCARCVREEDAPPGVEALLADIDSRVSGRARVWRRAVLRKQRV